ncbi:MAG: succinyldiaminopimelate transaminase [Rhodoluna sp.]
MFDRLPEYPWQKLKPYQAIAEKHANGMVDLSVGSPVDPTPKVIQEAIRDATNAPGYPSTAGSLEFREAVAEWFGRRRGVELSSDQVMPTIGSKEFISFLPLMLGLGKGDVIVQPSVAYTAYVVGAALSGAEIISEDDPAKWPENTKLIWINSPGNPDGRVLDVDEMKACVKRARELGAVLASDECYAELGWGRWAEERIPSVLDPRVCEGSYDNLLAVYSLSKQSNLAGYRAAFVAGPENLIKPIVNIRMHSGLIMPAPVQKAVIAALKDEEHVAIEREIYRKRREVLLEAVKAYGFEISDSEAGLYLWATLGEDCWATVTKMAELGILVVPGEFYQAQGSKYVRFSITASDEKVAEGAARLTNALGLTQ